MTAKHTASGERIKTFIQTWAGRDGPLYTNEVADICFEVDALVAAVTELQQRTNRCVFPACVEGEKPEFCGQCGDAERADAALRRAEQAERERDDWKENYEACGDTLSNVSADWMAAEARADTLTRKADQVVDEYHKWSEGASDGEFDIWRAPDFINAIIELRAVLAAGDGTTPTGADE